MTDPVLREFSVTVHAIVAESESTDATPLLLLHNGVMPRRGHFAAMEVPELYAPDVLAFTRTIEDNEFTEN